MNNQTNKNYIDNCFNRIISWFTINRMIILIVTFVFGMIIHFNKYSQNIMTTDAYEIGINGNLDLWNISIGRWLFPIIFNRFRFNINSNLYYTILFFIFLGFFSILINDFLNIKSKIFRVIDSIVLIVIPYTLNVLAFNNFEYNFALICSVLAAKYFYNNTKKSYICGIIFTVFILAIYQSMINILLLLLIFKYFIDYIEEKEQFIKAIKKIVVNMLFIIISFGIYFFISKIVVNIYGIALNEYGGLQNGITIKFGNIFIKKIYKCYTDFYEYYFTNTFINNSTYKIKYIYLAIIIIDMVLLQLIIIKIFIKNNNIKKFILKYFLYIIYIISFPIILNVFDLVIDLLFGYNITMSFGNIIPVFILIALIENVINNNYINSDKIKKTLLFMIIILLIALTYTYSIIVETTYIALEKNYKQIYNTLNRLVSRIESTDGYKIGMPIYIYNIKSIEYLSEMEISGNANLNRLSVFGNHPEGILKIILKEDFGIDISIDQINNLDEILSSKDYIYMNYYPDKDSIKIIDGVLIVKMGSGEYNYDYDKLLKEENEYYEELLKKEYDIRNSYLPYIPDGFHYVEGSYDIGYVIEDIEENQFVWIPCSKINYNNISKLEKFNYRKNAFVNCLECYDENYKDFLKSAFENGGFYISRYEIGNENNHPVSKANRLIWKSINNDETKKISEEMYLSNNSIKSELINGYAYDTTLKFILNTNKIEYYSVDTSQEILTGRNEYNNIFDFTDNVLELTLEKEMDNLIARGFSNITLDKWMEENRYSIVDNNNLKNSGDELGFRIILYK